jgi:hypothetical protein
MAYTTIKKPSDYFNTVTYTGTAGGQTISGVGHQPDFIWVKQRGDAGYDHSLHNSVSGLLKQLISNSTDAEITNTDTITSNNSDGFVLGADTAGPNANSNNQDTKNYVAWNWKANGAGVANTGGSISSTVSASATSGFSVVSYTGTGANATVGHGLGVAPSMIITKSTGAVSNWGVYHQSLGNTDALFLNETTATGANSVYWNNTSPTSSLFSVGSAGAMNNTNGMIAYCFAEKKGFSKFGSYTGNGSTDGTFIYTGFKPAFVLGKRTDSAGGWWLSDNKRSSGFNLNDEYLIADSNNAEQDDGSFASDFLSNGWKARATNGNFNESGGSYIYITFAAEPFTTSTGIPTTAR